MINQNYDYILYSGSVAGVVISTNLKRKGYSVLLLNRYGFCGGTITESLNLHQRMTCDLIKKDSITSFIIEKLINSKESYIFMDYNYFVLNPEFLKYELQRILVENGVDSLFHIITKKIEKNENGFVVTVYGREGDIKLNAKKIIDASSDFSFYSCLSPSDRELVRGFVNIITTPVKDSSIFDNAYKKILLNDKRWWVSYEIEVNNLFEIEIQSQCILDEINKKLLEQNSRIQLVPAQSNLIFKLKDYKKTPDFITFFDFVENFDSTDEFILSSIMEKNLTI